MIPRMQKSVLAMVMAGGRGQRLHPLTETRAKPAVPFGGQYRIIDFVLSNLVNSGIYSIYVLTQFKSQSLTEHLQYGWGFGSILRDHFVTAVPAQMQTGDAWYRGTADAIHQNLNLVRESRPHIVCIFGGDHIYRMDVSQMVAWHEQHTADCTVAAIPMPIEEASAFGVMEVDKDGRIVGFEEKPAAPKAMPGDPTRALVSMGNYVFSGRALVELLERDAADPKSSRDFGKDIIPGALKDHRMWCYDFTRNRVPGQALPNAYWRDVGTIDSYFDASMDLRAVVPQFNLYNAQWPIRSTRFDDPPAKFVHDLDNRTGRAVNSIVCAGSILSGATVRNSIIGRNVKIHSYADISDSIIFDHVTIGRGAKLHRCIVDKNNRIADGLSIGGEAGNAGHDWTVTSSGLVVVPKQPRFEGGIGSINI